MRSIFIQGKLHEHTSIYNNPKTIKHFGAFFWQKNNQTIILWITFHMRARERVTVRTIDVKK
jgi:hypothetical protein